MNFGRMNFGQSMKWNRFTCSAAVLTMVFTAALASTKAATLISEADARQQGLTRAWFSQVQLNPAQHRVESATLADKQMVVLTSSGAVQAINAQTGQTEWITRVGNPRFASLGPAVGPAHVAVVNGTSLFVLDRVDGREVAIFRTSSGVAAGPAIAEGHVYVPLFNGRLEAFSVHAKVKRFTPVFYSSAGRLFLSPVAGARGVVWANDRGALYGADASQRGVRYRFDGGSPIVATPATLGGMVYAPTAAGHVYALEESKGARRWRYSTGARILYSPVAIGETLYVATDEPALHALERSTGARKWVTGGVARFVAASQQRLYGLDQRGGLLVLDQVTGSPVSRIANRDAGNPVLNEQTDRLYVMSDDGLLQCLHEIGAEQPYRHMASQGSGTKGSGTKGSDTKGSDTKGSDTKGSDTKGSDTKPAGSDTKPAGDDPFADGGDAGDDPFADGGDDAGDDPFGDGDDTDDPFADPF